MHTPGRSSAYLEAMNETNGYHFCLLILGICERAWCFWSIRRCADWCAAGRRWFTGLPGQLPLLPCHWPLRNHCYCGVGEQDTLQSNTKQYRIHYTHFSRQFSLLIDVLHPFSFNGPYFRRKQGAWSSFAPPLKRGIRTRDLDFRRLRPFHHMRSVIWLWHIVGMHGRSD